MFNRTPHLNIVTQYSDDSDDDTSTVPPRPVDRNNTSKETNCETSTPPKPNAPKPTPYRRENRATKFKVGTVVTSVAVGDLQPLKEGQKRRQRNRLRGRILKKLSKKDNQWLLKFSNGHQGCYKQSVLKFENNVLVTHTLSRNSSNKFQMSAASSGVLCPSKTITPDRSDRKAILDFISNSIINNPTQNNNTNKSTSNMYNSILNTFKPTYPWLTSGLLQVHVHRTRKK